MTIKNWRYFDKNEEIGLLKITNGQFMTGNILGIIAERKEIQNETGHMLNAKTYDFPVRIKFVESYNGKNFDFVARDIRNKMSELEAEGCRCVVTSGGVLGFFDRVFHESNMLVSSSPLSVLEFVAVSISSDSKICIVSELLWEENCQMLEALCIPNSIKEKCIFTNLMLEETKDYMGNKVCNEKIGAYIWNSPEPCCNSLCEIEVPVYTGVKIAKFMKNVVTQIPYEGVI